MQNKSKSTTGSSESHYEPVFLLKDMFQYGIQKENMNENCKQCCLNHIRVKSEM